MMDSFYAAWEGSEILKYREGVALLQIADAALDKSSTVVWKTPIPATRTRISIKARAIVRSKPGNLHLHQASFYLRKLIWRKMTFMAAELDLRELDSKPAAWREAAASSGNSWTLEPSLLKEEVPVLEKITKEPRYYLWNEIQDLEKYKSSTQTD